MAEDNRTEHQIFVQRTLLVALVILGIAAALWLIGQLAQVLFMVFIALFVAVAFEPPVHFLAKRGWRRGIATGAVFLAGLILTGLFMYLLAPLFVEQIQALVDAIPGMLDALSEFLEGLGFDMSGFDLTEYSEQMVAVLQNLGPAILFGIIGFAGSVFGFLFFATTVALFAFYMLAELPQLQRTVLSFMPEYQQRRALHIWDVAVEKMGGYIYSRLILAMVSATVNGFFLAFLDVPFALPLGIFVGVVSQFIPVVGTYIAAILPAVVALTFNDGGTAIWVVIWFTGYQQIENYLISPRITKRTMEIHPAVSVAAIIIGGTLLGAMGILLALPMTGIIQAIIGESRKSYEVVLDDEDEVSEDADHVSDV